MLPRGLLAVAAALGAHHRGTAAALVDVEGLDTAPRDVDFSESGKEDKKIKTQVSIPRRRRGMLENQLKAAMQEKPGDNAQPGRETDQLRAYNEHTEALIAAVNQEMDQVHQELGAVLPKEQATVIEETITNNPELVGTLQQVRNKAMKHQEEAIKLSTDLHLMTQKYLGSYMKIEDMLRKIQASHLRWIPEITAETKNDFMAMKVEVSGMTDLIQKMKYSIADLEDYIKDGENQGMAKMDIVKERVKDLRDVATLNQKRLNDINRQNLKTIRDSTKEYDRAFIEVKKQLEMMPEMLAEKAMKLKEELLDQAGQRNEQLKDLGDLTVTQNKKFTRELNRMVDDGAASIDSVHHSTAELQTTKIKQLAKDRETFEKVGNKAIANIVKDGQTLSRDLGRSTRQSEQLNSMATEKLAAQQQDWVRFPEDIVKKVDDLKAQASNTNLEIRADRDKTMADMSNQFGTTMARMMASEAKQMFQEVQKEQFKTKTIAGNAARGADAVISPIVGEFDQLAVQAATDQQNVMASQQGQKDLTLKVHSLEEDVHKTEKNIDGRITQKDSAMLTEAKSVIEDEHTALQRSMGYLERARQHGVEKTLEREKELLAQVQRQSAEEQADMKGRLQTMDVESNQLQAGADAATAVLESSLGRSSKALGKMEKMLAKHNPRNFRGLLDTMIDETNAKILGTDATEYRPAERGVRDLALHAIEQSKGMVDQRIESYGNKATAAVGTVNTVTAPLKRKLEKEAGGAKDFIEKRAGYVYQMAQNKLNDAKLILEGDGEGTAKSLLAASNAEYKMQAGREDDDGRFIPGALGNTVLGAENKVAAMDGEAHSAMNGWTNQINARAAEWSDDEGEELSGIIPNAVTEVKEAAAAMKSEFLDEGEGLVDKAVDTPQRGVAPKLGQMKHDLDLDVDTAVKAMQTGATSLDESTRGVSMMASEAQAYRTRTSAALESDSEALSDAVASERQAISDMDNGLMGQLDKEGQDIAAGTARELQSRADAEKRDLLRGADQAQQLLNKAGAKTAESGKALAGSVEDLKAQAAAKADALGDSLSALRLSLEKQKNADAQSHNKLLFETEQMKGMQEKSAQKFENAIARTGRLLATLAEQDAGAVNGLTSSLDGIRDLAKKTVETQDQTDTERLKRLQADYKAKRMAVQQLVIDRHDQIEKFQKRLEQVTVSSEQALEDAEAAGRHFEEHLLGADRQFNKRVSEEKNERMMAVSEIETMAKQNAAQMSAIMGVIEQLEQKSTATVVHRLGTLDLDNQAIERKLTNTLELEKYQEADAIQKVYDKLNEARDIEAKLGNWRKSSVESGNTFRDLIVKEFSNLGHDLDLSKLELAEEQAMEQYAVDAQASALRQHLGDEIHGLSDVSQDRIDALARRTAKQLAALEKMEHLTKEERAKMMAEIKAKARDEANRILEENGRLELDQKTAARHMQIATDEITATLDRIGQIEDASAATQSHDIGHVFDKIQEKLHDINAHQIEAGEGEEETAAETTTAAPAAASLLEDGDTDRMLRVALAQSEASVEDDARLMQRAKSLLPQFA